MRIYDENGLLKLAIDVSAATFLTEDDETGLLPNSRALLAGTHIAFDDSVPGERTIRATPGGSTTEIQYNNAGAFAGDASFSWDATLKNLILGNTTTAATVQALDRATAGAGVGLTVRAGAANTSGAGGSVNVIATDGVGTNQNGGNLVLTAGNPTGSGTQGALQLVNMTATGAQTATFAAANKPGAATGAPTLWLRVVVGATTYWSPLFAD